MALRLVKRCGKHRLVLDFRYTDSDGCPRRYRKDASFSSRAKAKAEHDRLYTNAVLHGDPNGPRVEKVEAAQLPLSTFAELAAHYRATDLRRLKKSTQLTYTEVIDNILNPAFGAVSATSVDRGVLTSMVLSLHEAGLSGARQAKALCVARAVLKCALASKLVAGEPDYPRSPKAKKNAVTAPSATEAPRIISSASGAAALAIEVAFYTGLRAGELRALRWTDIDFDRDVLTVRRAVTRGTFDTPKSGHERVIPLNLELRAHLLTVKASAATPWQEVCLTRHGTPWGESGLNQAFKRACKKAGVTGYTFHCCRHFFVTELLRAGVGIHTVKELAGHADIATTQRYAHAIAADKKDAVSRLRLG